MMTTTSAPPTTPGPELHPTTPGQDIALRGTRLHVTLIGFAQKAVFEQTFVNQEQVAVEAVYTFPLPAEAAVCGFEVLTGDRLLSGQVEDNDKALELYDEAVSGGHAAFLLDQNRPDVFTVNVGNLKPKQAATIRISLVGPVKVQERRLRLAYPTTIAPRYTTATGQADVAQAVVDGEILNPPHVLTVPYGLTFDLSLRLGIPVRGVTSPTHNIGVVPDLDGGASVTLAAGVTEMNRDLVIEVELGQEAAPVALLATVPGTEPGAEAERHVGVTFIPEFETSAGRPPPPPADVVFLVDCSGSMQGESIAQAKAALGLCLRTLSEGDRFSICRFGTSFEFMAARPRGPRESGGAAGQLPAADGSTTMPVTLVYGEESLAQALAYVRQMDADLGGTELYPALAAVLGLPTRGRGGRDLILLTDGQVSNEGAVLALASKHAGTNRIFSFGIGSACSHYLVNGLAETTRGAAEFISGNERIEEKVLRTFSRLASPVLTDLSLDWGTGVRAEPAPAVLPPVFDGEPLTVYARLSGPGCTTLTLRGRLNGEPLEWTVPVTAAPDDGVLALLWARGAISDLEAALPADLRQPALRREPNQRRDVSRLVALSKRHGLLCSFTSFVAIEHRSPAERNEGRPALRRVPVQLAKGWHGIEVAAMAPLPAAGASDVVIERAFCMRHAAFREGVCNLVADSSCVSRLDRGPKYRLRPRPDAEGAAPPPRATAAAGLQALLATQGAVGWFEWQADTGDQLGFTREWLNQVRAELLQRFGLSVGTADKALADALLTLWLLRHRYGGDRGLWRRAADKALRAVVERLGLPRTEVEARLDSVTRPEPGVQ